MAVVSFACAERAADLEPRDPSPADAGGLLDVDASLSDSALPEDGSVDAATSSRCSAGGFCYTRLPALLPLVAVTASNFDDVWVAGGDTILHSDGMSWKNIYESMATSDLTFAGISATARDDVWAWGWTGSGDEGKFFFVRYAKIAGGAAAPREIPTNESFRSPAIASVSAWVTPDSKALWLASANDAFVRRFREQEDGTMSVDPLTPNAGPGDMSSYEWRSVFGFGADDVYVGGQSVSPSARAALAHYDGTSWSVVMAEPNEIVTAISGSRAPGEPRQLWIQTRTSSSAERHQSSIRLHPIAADGSLGVPLVTQSKELFKYDWTIGADRCLRFFGSVISARAAWISDGCLVYRWNGTELERVPTAVDGLPPGWVNGLWAATADDVWMVGTSLPVQGKGSLEAGFAARRTRESSREGRQP